MIRKIAVTFATIAMTAGICGSGTEVTNITLYGRRKEESLSSATPGVRIWKQKITFANFADIFKDFKDDVKPLGEIVGIFTFQSAAEYPDIKTQIISATHLSTSEFNQFNDISVKLDEIFTKLTDKVRAFLPRTHNIKPVPINSTWHVDSNPPQDVCSVCIEESSNGEFWKLLLVKDRIVLSVPITLAQALMPI